MAFTVAGTALDPHNGLATDGLICDAFNEETWFPSSSPVANTPEPGTPDATDTSGLLGASGVAGQFLITTPMSGSYWIATYNSWDPTVIAWVKAITHPHTPLTGWTLAGDVTSSRSLATTTVAAGSNAAVLPQGTINVASTTGFTAAGSIIIQTAGSGWAVVTYTGGGGGGTTFTGCTLINGSGTIYTGYTVMQAYHNGANRRIAFLSVNCYAALATNNAQVGGYAQLGGATSPQVVSVVGFDAVVAPMGPSEFQISLPIDPQGWYGADSVLSGASYTTLGRWYEIDF
jgi:hypothetical protein